MKLPTALLTLSLALLAVASAQEPKLEKAVFGAGCFWCVEAFFEQKPGVTDVVSGYAGGNEKNPTYEQVGGGRSGHAEVVQVTFDPSKTSYEKLVVLDGNGKELFRYVGKSNSDRMSPADFTAKLAEATAKK